MAALSERIEQAASLWARSDFAVALTGAGLSTGSGIPDFRSPQAGVWSGADPMQVASLATFRYAPEEFFAWVRPLANQMRRAQPNAAHRALAALEARGKLHAVITQNIDELHRRAGSQHVLEVHGSLHTATCVRCWKVWPGAALVDQFVADGEMPTCPSCGGLVKPDVTLMGEQLPLAVMRAAQQAARDCDLMLVAGSSLEVMPAGGLPVEALNHGARLVIVNQQPTYVDERADVVIHADVVQALPALAAAIAEALGDGHGAR
jgi:NAD-dependent deacetylase